MKKHLLALGLLGTLALAACGKKEEFAAPAPAAAPAAEAAPAAAVPEAAPAEAPAEGDAQ
ncbi:MAG: hypothetical protein ACREEM_37970 [Blastocatellia bacterium]